jgi:hypothetical protein
MDDKVAELTGGGFVWIHNTFATADVAFGVAETATITHMSAIRCGR